MLDRSEINPTRATKRGAISLVYSSTKTLLVAQNLWKIHYARCLINKKLYIYIIIFTFTFLKTAIALIVGLFLKINIRKRG